MELLLNLTFTCLQKSSHKNLELQGISKDFFWKTASQARKKFYKNFPIKNKKNFVPFFHNPEIINLQP